MSCVISITTNDVSRWDSLSSHDSLYVHDQPEGISYLVDRYAQAPVSEVYDMILFRWVHSLNTDLIICPYSKHARLLLRSGLADLLDKIKMIDLHLAEYTERDWVRLDIMGGQDHIINGAHFQDLINFTFMMGPHSHYITNYLYSKYCNPKTKVITAEQCAYDSSGMIVYDSRFDTISNNLLNKL